MRRGTVVRFCSVLVGTLVLAAALPLGVPMAVAGSTPFAVDEDIIYAPTPVGDEHFGSAVALSGNTLVVGVPDHDEITGLLDDGIAHVYVRSGTDWVWQASLHAPTLAAGDKFGTSVAIQGDTIVVGAPYRDGSHGESGAAYVFTRTGTTWSAAVPLGDEFAVAGDKMGQSVDIDGVTIAVGCPGRSSSEGAVRVYVWDGDEWNSGGGVFAEAPGGMPDDRLGGCVSLSGDTILASAGGFDHEIGSVVAFTRSGISWSFEDRFYEPVSTVGEQFGGPIDLQADGYVAVIGSPTHDVGAEVDKGIAYVYARGASGWELIDTLNNPSSNTAGGGDWFGSSVAFDGHNLILVGAFWDDDQTGAAYYFQLRDGEWVMAQKVTPPADPCCALFGDSVALDGGRAMVGATLASTPLS